MTFDDILKTHAEIEKLGRPARAIEAGPDVLEWINQLPKVDDRGSAITLLGMKVIPRKEPGFRVLE